MTSVAPGGHILIGSFVGGRGERLGGIAKGLLKTRGADGLEITLLERALGEARAVLPAAEVVLVGHHESYAGLGYRVLVDSPAGIGPLGGLHALLLEAPRLGCSHVLALACDLPFIRRELLQRLAFEQPQASALVATTEGVRNPLVARYAAATALAAIQSALASPRRSLQSVLDHLDDVQLLALSESEEATLRDWDTPADMQKSRVRS